MKIIRPRNGRGRPVCMGIDCDVEVPETAKYCGFHQYELEFWLRHSREALETAIRSYKGGVTL